MKKSKVTRSLLAACSIVALSAVMYGCVHSGDGPSVSALNLTGYDTADGATVMAGTYSIDDVPAALASALEGYSGTTMGDTGDTVTVGDYSFRCVAGPCSVSVSDDESRVTVQGTINVMKMAMMPPPPTPTENAMAALESTGSAAQTANTTLSAANAALGTSTNAVTAAAQAFSNATGDAIATAKAAYDAAVADLMMKKEAQANAAMALGEAIAAYEMAHGVLSILDPTNAALAPAATAIAALKMAQADMTAVAAADAALAVAANTADPVTTKAAYDAAVTAHDTAMSMQATEKGKLDAATEALADARTALEGASGDGIAPAVEAYNAAVDDLAAAQAAYDTAVADTKARLDTLDMALAAWAKADPDAVGLKDAMAMIAKLKADQDEAAKKAAADLKEVQDQLTEARNELQRIRDEIAAEAKKIADAATAARNAGYTAALAEASRTPSGTDPDTADNRQANRRKMAIGYDQPVADADAIPLLTIERRTSLKLTAAGYMQGDAAPSIGSGWNGGTLTRNRVDDDGEKLTDITGDTMAYVYSDIEQAESDSTKITTFAAPDATGADDTPITTYIPVATTIAAEDTGVFSIRSTGEGKKWWEKDSGVTFASGILPTSLNTSKALPDNFAATINGISGTIRCATPDSCTIKRTGTNEYEIVTASGESLSFMPTAGKDATVTTYEDDGAYLTFGWWIVTPDDKKAAGYRFGSFATSMDDATTPYTIPAAVTGKASYRGPAAGIYAEKKHGDQEARSGMFTAEANLTADFLGTNAGAHVSGSVSKFMSGGESLGNWTVNLRGSAIVDADGTGGIDADLTDNDDVSAGDKNTGVYNDGTGLLLNSGMTTGDFDGLAVTGVWQGQFAGNPASPDVAGSTNDAPNNIIGTFDASTHGSSPAGAIQVSGAFGAEKQ